MAFMWTFTLDSVLTSLSAMILFDAPSVSVRKMTNSRRDRPLTTSLPGGGAGCLAIGVLYRFAAVSSQTSRCGLCHTFDDVVRLKDTQEANLPMPLPSWPC